MGPTHAQCVNLCVARYFFSSTSSSSSQWLRNPRNCSFLGTIDGSAVGGEGRLLRALNDGTERLNGSRQAHKDVGVGCDSYWHTGEMRTAFLL
ncbi:hypothetical protein AVEN_202987-1 [Araneus ventricosus]|uniref:Uncharacterized protein n=1 Tax=Araneus ventricosus TaxID=182803 RepID=A0A4Y2INY6_ARAVE|nr:hypothetical protein AVEN_226912-1 [Araneus ventricosus]GBM79561.1 hypothetical protein AVEN_10468-1 [Araneus ventricosus]GBM79582.1 hypothetical protein AVEN_84733-1 [Araneus ventricosus]GBM79624.1 hypothetical protein AVEN_202987-1 [Araneus ventricosus]